MTSSALNHECLDGQSVAVESETTDDALAGTGNQGLVTEILTLVYI